MSQTLDAVKAFLAEDGFSFEQENPTSLFVPIADDLGKWAALCYDVNECFVCTSVLPVNVPADRRAEVAELLARLNWPLIVGNWEMDVTDGEVRYKTSAPARAEPLSVGMARDLCRINFSTFRRAWGTVLAVATGGQSAAAAFAALVDPLAAEREAFERVMRKIGFDDEALQ